MIKANSRYTTATLQTITGPDNVTRQEMRVPFPGSRSVTYTYYRVKGFERVDVLANRYYGNGALWWVIADANPEIMNWLDLVPGTEIRIPNA